MTRKERQKLKFFEGFKTIGLSRNKKSRPPQGNRDSKLSRLTEIQLKPIRTFVGIGE
jgi:hypothetical protein